MLLRVTCVFAILFFCYVYACELDQTQHGCRIDNGQCTCSYGCRSEFRYATKRECQDALKGRTSDICSRAPCMNNGHCIQVSQMPGYKCRCEGTGYWGSRCQRLCPTGEEKVQQPFPVECIVI
ncbi:protein crumbs-like [Bradysia coprophila]|uniref:protein crumbs-like n=1 Tax=Bradysia coprophila TaxID=38358 RepID=UPI00187DB6A4|nr:protein crumbs-like [Bradysia coprophila]